MKNFIIAGSASLALIISCNKKEETVDNQVSKVEETAEIDSSNVVIDSVENFNIKKVQPLNIDAKRGRAVFTVDNSTIFYFDLNENKGSITLDGKIYQLDKADFTENNYFLSGKGISIEATNGDFGEMVSDCVYGTFPEVKISAGDTPIILKKIKVQDCPAN